MDLNRNQFFFLGIVVLLLGLQFRMVQSYVLTRDATQFLAEHTGQSSAATSLAGETGLLPNKTLQPPEWLGWCMISVGAVFILHSLAMKRPG